MAYNAISGDYLISQINSIEDVPFHLMRLAINYRDQLDQFEPDTRKVLQHIVDNFLVEGEETVSLTGSDATNVDEGTDATAAEHVGDADLSNGYDWGTTPQEFTLDGTTVTLDTTTSDVATTVTEINDALSTAGVSGVEAFADGDNVGIRTTATGSTESFTLAEGEGEGNGALSTLGMTADTYTGTDEIAGTWAEFQPNFGNVGVEESSFVVEVNESVVNHTVQGYDPLTIRINSVPASDDSVVFMATNPLTKSEWFKPALIDPADYIYKE